MNQNQQARAKFPVEPPKPKPKIPEMVKEIIRISDIILEILDARFISETRNKELEEMILARGKKLMYVINKDDIVDRRAKIEEAESLKLFPYFFVSCKKRTGIKRLRNRIKAEARKEKVGEGKGQVGIIGDPNTGKSSVINILSRRGAARTSSQAGYTRGVQRIRFTSEIRILDTPGIIPTEEYSHIQEGAIKKHSMIGARTANTIRDPEMVVADLMKRYSKQIERFYGLSVDGDSEALIEQLGRKKGFLKKGGVVDEPRTAKTIIRDWQEGKIRV